MKRIKNYLDNQRNIPLRVQKQEKKEAFQKKEKQKGLREKESKKKRKK